jgi:protease PrsW
LGALPVAALSSWLVHNVPLAPNPWAAFGATRLLFIALPEEVLKISIIATIVLRARDIVRPMDAIVIGAASALGFAALENVLFLAMTADAGPDAFVATAIVRTVVSVPFHAALDIIAAAYIARVRFGVDRGGRWRLLARACLVPLALHALFDATDVSSLEGFKIHIDFENEDDAVIAALMMLIQAVVGIGTIVYAVLLVRRFGRRQRARARGKPLPPAHWRSAWALCLGGLGLSLVALTLLIPRHWGVNVAGCVLLAGALITSWRCGSYLRTPARPAALKLI